MNEIDTPESYSASYGTRGDLYELCRKLERERNQYKAKIAEFTTIEERYNAMHDLAEKLERETSRFTAIEEEIEDRDCPSCGGPMTDNSFRGDPKCRDCGLERTASR